jgi:hypothetical protein
MTAAGISDEGHRVALAVGALVLGAIAMGASVLFVRWAEIARPRAGEPVEVGL